MDYVKSLRSVLSFHGVQLPGGSHMLADDHRRTSEASVAVRSGVADQ